MKAIESILNVSNNGELSLLEMKDFIRPGKYKIILVINESEPEIDEPLSSEIEIAYKNELDRRTERMKNNPHPGYSMDDVIAELEEELGKKLQVRTRS